MSFRKRGNRHDEWKHFLNAHKEQINVTELPATIFHSEERLVRFLSEGMIEEETVNLTDLPDDRFQRLEAIVNAYFCNGWEQASWASLAAERLRRFGRYA